MQFGSTDRTHLHSSISYRIIECLRKAAKEQRKPDKQTL